MDIKTEIKTRLQYAVDVDDAALERATESIYALLSESMAGMAGTEQHFITGHDSDFQQGYNAARSEIIKRMEERLGKKPLGSVKCKTFTEECYQHPACMDTLI